MENQFSTMFTIGLRCQKRSKKIIVACSNNKSDDKIYSYCKSEGYLVVRGSLNNVVQRFQK